MEDSTGVSAVAMGALVAAEKAEEMVDVVMEEREVLEARLVVEGVVGKNRWTEIVAESQNYEHH